MIGARTHRDHRPAFGQLGVSGKLTRGADAIAAIDRGDQLLPCRSPDLISVVISRRPCSRKPVSPDAVLGQHQVEHRGHQLPADPHRRDAAADDRPAVGVADIETRQVDGDRFRTVAAKQGQRGDGLGQAQVPASFVIAPAEARRPVGNHRPAGVLVENDRLPVGVLVGITEVGGGQEPIRRVSVATLAERDQQGQVGEPAGVVAEVRHLPVGPELAQDHMAHRHCERAVCARVRRQPAVGELRVLGVVRADHHHLLAVVAGLGHEMGIGRARGREVGTPHDQVSGVPPVARLGHVGLIAKRLR